MIERSGSRYSKRSETHSHHWIIETPNGATSEGRCKTCGSYSVFKNSPDDRFDPGIRPGKERFLPLIEKGTRTKGKTCEEKVEGLNGNDLNVLQYIANGIEPAKIKEALDITQDEYQESRTNCKNAGKDIYNTIKLGIRQNKLTLIDPPPLDFELSTSDEQFLDKFLVSMSINTLSEQLKISRLDLDEQSNRIFSQIGAKNNYHAAAILEYKAMQDEYDLF